MVILESIYITHRFYQVCNLTQLELERKTWTLVRCRPLECYSVCVLLISSCLLFYNPFTTEDYVEINDNNISRTIDIMQMFGIRLAHIFFILETMARRKEQQKLYEKLQEIDRIFECSLKVFLDKSSFRRKILKYGVIMLTIHISSELLLLGITFTGPYKNFSIFLILYLVPYIISGLRYLQIFTAILIIKQRFKRLIASLNEVNLKKSSTIISTLPPTTSKLIHSCVEILENTDRMNHHFDMENKELQQLLIIHDLYNRLWELTALLNRCVGVSVLIIVTNDFLIIFTNCYWIYYSYIYSYFLQVAGSVIWSITHLCNVIVLAVLCDRMVQSTTDIALRLHRIPIDFMNENHTAVIKQFSLQLLHQKITFTAAGFFNIDYKLLYTIVGATTTYTVVLIQIQMIS